MQIRVLFFYLPEVTASMGVEGGEGRHPKGRALLVVAEEAWVSPSDQTPLLEGWGPKAKEGQEKEG